MTRAVAEAGPASVGPGGARREYPLRAVVGWVLYDLANTVFAYAILTRYFNEWIIVERGQPDILVGFMTLGVGLVLLVTLPLAGALADRLGRRKPFLVAFTLVSVAATALLAFTDGLLAALLVAGVAIFAYNSALAHYDPLLAAVAPPERRGLVSGLGVGVGYVGVLLAIVLLGRVVEPGQNQDAFLPVAAMFLVLSIPCFLWVRDRPPATADSPDPSLRPGGPGRAARRERPPRRARGARPAARRALSLRGRDRDRRRLHDRLRAAHRRVRRGEHRRPARHLAGLRGARRARGGGAGRSELGPKRVLAGTLVVFAAVLLMVAVSGAGMLLWLAGPAVGIAFGAVWTSDRVFLVRLCPEERRGEAFGLYTLVGKASSGVGPIVLWGGVILLLTNVLGLLDAYDASRVAVGLLALAALAGLAVLWPLSDAEGRAR